MHASVYMELDLNLLLSPDRALPVLVGLAASCNVAFFLYRRPRAALTLWLAALALVPFWLAVPAGRLDLTPATVASILVLPAAARPVAGDRMRRGDLVLLAAAVATALAVYVNHSSPYNFTTLVLQGCLSYFIGRRLTLHAGAQWTTRAIARFGVVCAAWSIIEFGLHLHVFEHLAGAPDLSFWNGVQVRGGFDRSEAAWGHAIALGGWLALTMPFVVVAKLKFFAASVIVMLAGVVLTFSRGPIIGCLVALLLAVLFLHDITGRQRATVLFVAMVGGALVLPTALDFIGATSGELDQTANYRSNLLTYVRDDLHLLSRASNASLVNDKLLYRGFGSIDNEFLLRGVEVGALVVAILAVGLIAALLRTLRGRGTPADVALAAQIIVLFTVAMITQYQAAVFFIAGVAVALATAPRAPAPDFRHLSVPGGEAGALPSRPQSS